MSTEQEIIENKIGLLHPADTIWRLLRRPRATAALRGERPARDPSAPHETVSRAREPRDVRPGLISCVVAFPRLCYAETDSEADLQAVGASPQHLICW